MRKQNYRSAAPPAVFCRREVELFAGIEQQKRDRFVVSNKCPSDDFKTLRHHLYMHTYGKLTSIYKWGVGRN